MKLTAEEAWGLVVRYLKGGRLTTKQDVEVRKLADGFGDMDPKHDCFWDWSHVRDSTDKATVAMGYKILTFLRK